MLASVGWLIPDSNKAVTATGNMGHVPLDEENLIIIIIIIILLV